MLGWKPWQRKKNSIRSAIILLITAIFFWEWWANFFKDHAVNASWYNEWFFKRENWKNETLWTFVCHNKTSHTFDNFGHVLPFFNEKNSKLNFKNVKKYENRWKHKYDNIYV